MNGLSETWFAEGYIDFELKKYMLLAYLQEVNSCFNEHKLYPQLSELLAHYDNLTAFRENKQVLQNDFPKRLSQINLQRLQLLYEKITEDDELMQELESIIHYAIGQFNSAIKNGTALYDSIEEKLYIAPIGLVPLDHNEGYLLLSGGNNGNIRAYQYRLSIFEKHNEKYRAIKTAYINSWQKNYVNTYHNIKAELIRNRQDLPNPAVYSVETPLSCPLDETLLPIAKRSLVRYISHNAA